MTAVRGDWVRKLRPEPEWHVEPVCSPAVLAPAIEQVGPDAVAWAVHLGYEIAERCVEMFPVFGKGAAQLATVRLGTESAAITAMRMIDCGDTLTLAITAETVRAIQDYVHRGIPLPVVWKAVRQGHAWLADAYMRACVETVPIDEQPPQLQRSSEALFEFVNHFMDDISSEYSAEHERWVMTTVAAREDTVKSLLAGTNTDTPAAESVLHYHLAHRVHLGVVLWFERPAASDDSTLHKVAASLLQASGAEQTLVLSRGMSALHAWGNSVREIDPGKLRQLLDDHDGIRCAVG
ncbi:hypothetical protein [Nocardia sp. NPDC004123]